MSFSSKRIRRNKLRKAARELHTELVKQGIMKPEPEGPLFLGLQSKLAPNSFAKEANNDGKRIEKQNRKALGKFFPGRGY